MNVIPSLDFRQGQCVRLYKGDFDCQTTYDMDPVSLARKYQEIGFDDLHIVDLDGAQYGRQQNQDLIQEIVSTSRLTVQLGGGIRTESEISSWLNAGVARVVIGSLAVNQPDRVRKWLGKYGPERVVIALDVNVGETGVPHVATHGWTRSAELSLWQCLSRYLSSGLRHVLCTDISRDGALAGPNIELYSQLIDRFPDILLQASGGVRDIGDLEEMQDIGVRAAISGRALLDGRITATEIASFLPAA